MDQAGGCHAGHHPRAARVAGPHDQQREGERVRRSSSLMASSTW